MVRPSQSGELAYAVLEEARLVCERLSGGDVTHAGGLRVLHRQLGMAGFYVSCEMAELRRRRLLQHAKARCDERFGAEADLCASLQALAQEGRVAIEHALQLVGPCDHLHLAHVYLLDAAESLEVLAALLGSKPGAVLTSQSSIVRSPLAVDLPPIP